MQTEQIERQGKFVAALFAAWNANRIDYVVLRNYQNLPHDIGNDLDILVSAVDQKKAEDTLVSIAKEHGFVLLNRACFSQACIHLFHSETLQQLQIDLFTSIRWRFFDIITPEVVLASRIRAGQFFTPTLEHEALISVLSKLLYQEKVEEKYYSLISGLVRSGSSAVEDFLAERFGRKMGGRLLRKIREGDWPEIENLGPQLRKKTIFRQLTRRGFVVLRNGFSDSVCLFKRYLSSPGVFVVLVGPDGCGKSSVPEGLQEELNSSLRRDKSLVVHWKPRVFSTPKDASGAGDPHGEPLRGRIGSIVFFGFHCLEFILGYWKIIKPVVFRNGMVIGERYYYDFFVDQRRYRLSLPSWIVKLGFVFVKKPDLVFGLDADPGILQARKREVPLKETVRQREAYRALLNEFPNGHVIDASQSLENVVHDVQRIVLEYMAERTARRLEVRANY